MIRFLRLSWLLIISFSCVKVQDTSYPPANDPVNNNPINNRVAGLSDTSATLETKALYAYLKNSMGKRVLFGQQFSTYYRQGGLDKFCAENISDCYTSVGDHPAILGVNYNSDSAILRAHILNAKAHGGIVTVHWTMPNPVTGKDVNDTTRAVYSILSGGENHDFYINLLKTLAAFFKSLKDAGGSAVPIIFRPFHENNGNGKWWGRSHCTAQQYIQLYRETVSYLRDTMQVHNVIYAYSPSNPLVKTNEEYSVRYPGDGFVDVIGFDKYDKTIDDYSAILVQTCRFVVNFALERNKVAAITETGISDGIQNTDANDYFMEHLLLPILADSVAKKVAYLLTWANTSSQSYWVPLPGQPNFESLKRFYAHPYTIFQRDLPNDIYKRLQY